jgi:Short C-terminal domain
MAAGCTYLGGAGYGLEPRTSCDLVFTEEGLRIVWASASEIIGEPYGSLVSIDITGTVTKSGGGFLGGGFGLQGAAEGMAIAALLNTLSAKTNINTVIHIETATGELFFHTSAMSSDALRMQLSPAFTRLRLARGEKADPEASIAKSSAASSTDVIDQLARLADLRDRGAITEEEFKKLKADLLG